MLMTKNTANIRTLNDMNKTALYYASKERKKKLGWQQEVGNVLNYEQLTQGDLKTKKDREMAQLVHEVIEKERNTALFEARRRKSKQPCSLNLEQEDYARQRFRTNKLRKPVSQKRNSIRNLINIDCGTGLVNDDIYKRYDDLLLQQQATKLKQAAS